MDKLLDSEDLYGELFVYTRHSLATTKLKPGVKLTGTNKEKFCYDLKINTRSYKIIPSEETSIHELSNFGINPNGSFTSQVGKDDIAMTMVNLNAIFDNGDFEETVSEIYEEIPEKFKKAIETKLEEASESSKSKTGDISNYSFLNDLL
jgi:hypothetical protein